jgi:protein TonB
MLSNAPRVALPIPVRPPQVIPVRAQKGAVSAAAMSAPAAAPMEAATQRFDFRKTSADTAEPVPTMVTNLRMGPGGAGALSVLTGPDTVPGSNVSVVRAREIGPVRVSKGVFAGLLLTSIQPVYPAIAKAAGVQGTVVMEAVISKAGRLESLHAGSGPEMLRNAALEAVGAARYRPYLLNGEPTEVQTTITVVFKLGS